MRYARIIVDGFSLLHRDAELKALLDRNPRLARHKLVERVTQTALGLAPSVIVVFDGHAGINDAFVGSPVEVRFSDRNQTADALIERMVTEDADPSRILVVTSDRAEREQVHAYGAETQSCGDFLARSVAMRATTARTASTNRTRPHQLGEYFPSS